MKAEEIQNETHWKNTSEALRDLQEKWKTIGPVPDSKNDKIWKRFRTAFDHFYSAKKDFFEKRKSDESGVLEIRNTVLKALEELKEETDPKELLGKLKTQQKAWNDAGHVSGKAHFSTYNKYRALSDELYDRCRKEGVAAKQKNFKEHLSKLTEKSNAGDELGQEERRIRGRMRTIQEEIDGFNDRFGKWEQIKRFELTPEVWSIELGHLTPTIKMKRKVIHQRYSDLVEKIYADTRV